MQFSKFLPVAFVLASLTFPLISYAQDTTAQPPLSDLSLGQELVDDNPVGSTYTREEYGDWQLRCVLTVDGKDPCQLYQLMANEAGNPVAEIILFELPPDQDAVVGATIATPLETLLTQQLILSVDDNNAKRYPFSYCSVNGCYARIGLTFSDIGSFKRGAVAKVTIARVAAPDQPVVLKMSLSGFTTAYAAMLGSNAALRQE